MCTNTVTLPLNVAKLDVVAAVDDLLAVIEDGGDVDAGVDRANEAVITLQSVLAAQRGQ
jgi:hypothetical protein